MAKLNRFLIFAALVLALAAMAFSVLLMAPREAFSKRAGADAEALVKAVNALSKGSGSDLAKSVTLTPANPEAGTKEEGTMSWLEYKNSPDAYQKRLNDVVALAEDVTRQRDLLAGRLAEVAAALGQEVKAEELCNLKSAAEAAPKVAALAAATKERDDKMIAAIINAGAALSLDISRPAFNYDGTAFGPYAAALTELEGKATNTADRAAEYAKTLEESTATLSEHTWDNEALGKLRDPEGFRAATTAFRNGAADINLNLKDRAEIKAKLEERIKELEGIKEEKVKLAASNQEAKVELASLKVELAELRKINVSGPAGTAGQAGGVKQVDPNLTGKVLYVDKDYKYVVLDLGKNQVPEKARLLVHRGETLLGAVLVSRVTDTVCVAEIMPDAKKMADGDQVIPSVAGGL